MLADSGRTDCGRAKAYQQYVEVVRGSTDLKMHADRRPQQEAGEKCGLAAARDEVRET